MERGEHPLRKKDGQVVDLGLDDVLKMPISFPVGKRFVTRDFAFVNGFDSEVNPLFVLGTPIRLKEGRIMRVLSGEATVIFNLRRYHLVQDMLVVLSPNTLVQVLQFSEEANVQMLGFSQEYLRGGEEENPVLLKFFSGNTQFVGGLSEEEKPVLISFFSLLYELVFSKGFSKEAARSVLVGLLHWIDEWSVRHDMSGQEQYSRQEKLFYRFLDLVNKYSLKERTVAFYAGQLCLSPRYLNTLIRQVSHKTVMDWVNESVVLEAKVLLRHTDKPVYEIAEALNFPNASFFVQFFRRAVGQTPLAYRNAGSGKEQVFD